MPDAGRARPLRRRPARVLRRARGARGGRALPPPRHRRPRHPRRAPRGGRRALRRPRRAQPDQRPQPRPARPPARRARPARDRHPRSCGATATPSRSSRRRSTRRSTSGPPGSSPLLTSAYSCYSSCRQYREDLAAAVDEVGPAADGLVVDKVRPYAVHPGSRTRVAARRSSRRWARCRTPRAARILYVTHSIPEAMDDTSGPGDGEGNLYVDQHLRLARRLTDELNAELGLDGRGRARVLLALGPADPALARARRQRPHRGARRRGRRHRRLRADRLRVRPHGGRPRPRHRGRRDRRSGSACPFVRVATPGTDELFVEGLVDLLLERAAEARGEVVVPGDVAAR